MDEQTRSHGRGLEAAVRAGALLIPAAAAGYVLTQSPVISPDEPLRGWAVAGFRVLFGVLTIVRLQRLRAASLVLWPASGRLPWDRWLPVGRVITLWQAAAVALVLGLATPIVAAICFASCSYIFRRSYTHSLEDILFQLSSLFLVFAAAGEVASVDRLLGWDFRLVDPGLAINLWWLGIATLMFSAGFEKIWSPMWRQGLGFRLFVGLPHLVQPAFRFTRQLPRIGWLLSWMTVVAELGLLMSTPVPELRLVFTCLLIGFAISLFIVVDLSFIGQLTLANLTMFAALEAVALWSGASDPAPLLAWSDPMTWVLLSGWLIVVAGTLAPPLGGLEHKCTALSRYTLGLEPIRVFTDTQLYGIYLYRVIAVSADGHKRDVVPTFTPEGASGPLQRWHPRVFLKLTYEVTDLLLRMRKRGWTEARGSRQFEATRDLMRCGLSRVSSSERPQVDRVELLVMPVELDDEAGLAAAKFSLGGWHPVIEAPVYDGTLGDLKLVAEPPAIQRTAR